MYGDSYKLKVSVVLGGSEKEWDLFPEKMV